MPKSIRGWRHPETRLRNFGNRIPRRHHPELNFGTSFLSFSQRRIYYHGQPYANRQHRLRPGCVVESRPRKTTFSWSPDECSPWSHANDTR
ncbi:unnamed protein product [Ectocarpus sp. 12 AP-2014]